MYDVVIIGAGPAGTAAAYPLACGGQRVLMLDRRRFPRKKACAGGITPKAMDLFPYDISHLVLRTCRRVKITRPGGSSFVVQDKRPFCHMVQRRDLDDFSLGKAMDAGAEFRVIDRILCLSPGETRSGASLTVLEDGREKRISARFIVGADGANSCIRQLIAGSASRVRQIEKLPALEADVVTDRPQAVPMEFDFSRGIPGYYWVFPRNDHVNIGIYSSSPRIRPYRRLLAAFARERFGHDRLEAIKGYPIGVGRTAGRLCGKGRVLLAGDAAGFAEPLLGEGIYGALKSGRLAGEAIGQALETGRPDAVKRYRSSLKRLRFDLSLYHAAAGFMYRFPAISLRCARHPFVLGPFARGYAAGRSLSQIVFPF